MLRNCIYCHKDKDLSEFYNCKTVSSAIKDGHSKWCRECQSIKYSDWYKKNKRPNREPSYGKGNFSLWYHTGNNRLHVLCKNKVLYAIKTGKLKKAIVCESCGLIKKLHGHHRNYNKPLEVVWLCASCHQKEHNEVKSKTLT